MGSRSRLELGWAPKRQSVASRWRAGIPVERRVGVVPATVDRRERERERERP